MQVLSKIKATTCLAKGSSLYYFFLVHYRLHSKRHANVQQQSSQYTMSMQAVSYHHNYLDNDRFLTVILVSLCWSRTAVGNVWVHLKLDCFLLESSIFNRLFVVSNSAATLSVNNIWSDGNVMTASSGRCIYRNCSNINNCFSSL